MRATPLAGYAIALTRPREQADGLAQRILQLGGIPLRFPLLEIAPPADPQPLRAQLNRLAEFQLAIFISPNAVRYGLAALREAALPLPPTLQFAAVGQGSAQALFDGGIRSPVLAPTGQSDSEALLALPQLRDVARLHVLIFRGDGGREWLADTLRARGATVEYAECYLRRAAPINVTELLAARPAALTLTSSEALTHLWQAADQAARQQLVSLPLFVLHPRIGEAARELGWQAIHVTAGGEDGLLTGLLDWVKERA